jgi:PAS domain S-box-containing protein
MKARAPLPFTPPPVRASDSVNDARALFERAPVPLWIEDYSPVTRHLTRLRQQGVENIRTWLDTEPGAFDELAAMLRIVDCNSAAVRLFGAHSREELLLRIHETYLPETHLALREKLIALFEGRTEARIEVPYRRLDGNRIQLLVGLSLPQPGEPLDMVVVSTVDITARVRAEGALEISEQRLELALWAADLAIWDWDIPSAQSFLSARGFEMLGYEQGEIQSTIAAWKSLVHPEDLARVNAALEAHLYGCTPFYQCEHRLLTKSGGWCWVLNSGRVHERAEDGSPVRASGIYLDITAQKRTAATVERGQRRFREMIQHAPIGMVLFDHEGSIQQVNPALCEMLGYMEREFEALTLRDVTHRDDWDAGIVAINRAVSDPNTVQVSQRRLIRKPGEELWTRMTLFGIDLEGEEQRGILAHVEDITGLRVAEEERLALRRKREKSQRLESLGVLAGGIAHDFNNLLVGILGNAQLAQNKLSSEHAALANVRYIESAANQAADLTSQMLAYSGGGRFVLEPIDIGELIRNMHELLEVPTKQLRGFDLRLADRLPHFEADKSQIRQLLLALVTNAAEAIGDEGGRVSITTGSGVADRAYLGSTYIDDDLPAGHYVWLEVIDDGPGVDGDTRARMFEPFFTTKRPGRGLGLAAVLGIVRSHRGAVRVDSKPGHGTRVRVLFPAVKDREARQSEAGRPEEGPAAPRTVLVVDDEPGVRGVARESLELAGYRVLVAEEGGKALRMYDDADQDIDIVLLDLVMPGLSGLQVLGRLRQLDPEVRVVLMSGHNREPAMAHEGERPAAFLRKPYTPQDLTAIIAAQLEEA